MRRNSGFTLIELMMVLAVMAILVAVALPSYQRYQVRGIRSQGQQFLMDLAQAQEQFFLDQRQYATVTGDKLKITFDYSAYMAPQGRCNREFTRLFTPFRVKGEYFRLLTFSRALIAMN